MNTSSLGRRLVMFSVAALVACASAPTLAFSEEVEACTGGGCTTETNDAASGYTGNPEVPDGPIECANNPCGDQATDDDAASGYTGNPEVPDGPIECADNPCGDQATDEDASSGYVGSPEVPDGPIECADNPCGDVAPETGAAQSQAADSPTAAGTTESSAEVGEAAVEQGAADGSVSGDQISDGSVESVTLARTGASVLPLMMLGLTSLLLGLGMLSVKRRRWAHVLARGPGSA